MTSEEFVEMFEGDSADICAGKFPLVSMGGRAEGLACASGNCILLTKHNGLLLLDSLPLLINGNTISLFPPAGDNTDTCTKFVLLMSRVRGEHSVKHAQTQEWLLKHTGRKILKNARISFYPKSCDLKLHEIFWDPLISPSGRKVCGVEKGKKEE